MNTSPNIGKNFSQAIIASSPAPEIQHVYRITPTLSNIKLEKESLVKSFKNIFKKQGMWAR